MSGLDDSSPDPKKNISKIILFKKRMGSVKIGWMIRVIEFCEHYAVQFHFSGFYNTPLLHSSLRS